MIDISLLITAPHGAGKCLVAREILASADGASLDIVIADASAESRLESRPGLRHVRVPGGSVFALRQAGLRNANTDWVVVVEDHCRPMPGLLDAFRTAIRNHPDVDLFSGAVTNATSTSRWQWAHFLYGARHHYWPPAGMTPDGASIANLAIRRSCIRPDELGEEGGFETLARPRLARSGRYRHCPEAVVDHIEALTWLGSGLSHFHNARMAGTFMRRFAQWSGGAALARVFGVPLNRVILVPWRTALHVRGTPPSHWSLLPRLMLIGIFSATGLLLGYFAGPGSSPAKVG
jgi:hypothetical protein